MTALRLTLRTSPKQPDDLGELDSCTQLWSCDKGYLQLWRYCILQSLLNGKEYYQWSSAIDFEQLFIGYRAWIVSWKDIWEDRQGYGLFGFGAVLEPWVDFL